MGRLPAGARADDVALLRARRVMRLVTGRTVGGHLEGDMRTPSASTLCAVRAALFGLLVSCRPAGPSAAAMPEPAQPVVEYVTTQEILTPLPLRVWLPARYGAERVLVFFQTWGSRRWETLELGRAGQTWAGEVSCHEVSTVTGDTRYFFLAVDAMNHPVIGSGWPEWSHVVTVVRTLPDGARALPGMLPPGRCHDPADCPPDFLGCPAYAVRRTACREDADCGGAGRCAWDGYCSDPSGVAEVDSDEAQLAAAVHAALGRRRQVALAR